MSTATFKIWRGDASGGSFRDYMTEISEGMVVLDAWGRPEDEDLVLIRGSWFYLGWGYQSAGEAWLASPRSLLPRISNCGPDLTT